MGGSVNRTWAAIAMYHKPLGIPEDQIQAAVAYVQGGILQDWKAFVWNIGPGIPHPRGLQVCKYFTSWEITVIMGIDFCSGGELASLRLLCPISCKCTGNSPGCPSSCPMVQS